MQPTEIWLPIPGHPGYEASSLGRIRSVDRDVHTSNGHVRHYRGRVLKPAVRDGRYQHVVVDQHITERVHVLVCLTFHGERPSPSHVVRHLNDRRLDNRACNLAWGTQSDNLLDAVENGLNAQRNAATCPNGHDYSTDNVRVTVRGRHTRRTCLTCERATARRKAQRLKLKNSAAAITARE